MERLSQQQILNWRRDHGTDNDFRRQYLNNPPVPAAPVIEHTAGGRRVHNVGEVIPVTELHRGFALSEWLRNGARITSSRHLSNSTRFDQGGLRMELEDAHLVSRGNGLVYEFIVKTNEQGILLSFTSRRVDSPDFEFNPVSMRVEHRDGSVSRWTAADMHMALDIRYNSKRHAIQKLGPVAVWHA